jgi:hypothetical protein
MRFKHHEIHTNGFKDHIFRFMILKLSCVQYVSRKPESAFEAEILEGWA